MQFGIIGLAAYVLVNPSAHSVGAFIIDKTSGKRVNDRPKKFRPEQIEHAMQLITDNSFTEVERMTGISKSMLIRESRRRKAETIAKQG